MFLFASSGTAARTSRLKDFLLLLLRSLILVALVVVFARPALFSYSTRPGDSPKTLAIVIDNSFSMQYADNFKKAKKSAREAIDSLADGSFVAVAGLVPTSSEKLVLTNNRRDMHDQLEALTLSNTYTDNEKRILDVINVIGQSKTENKELLLITDMQKNGWGTSHIEHEWFSIEDITDGKKLNNIAVTDASALAVRDELSLSVELSSYSDNAISDVLLTARVGGEELKSIINLEPNNNSVTIFTLAPDNKLSDTLHSGTATIPNDQLTIDDSRYFSITPGPNQQVLVVDGDPSEDPRLAETYYLEQAVRTLSETNNTTVRVKDSAGFLKDSFAQYSTIILANVSDITPEKSKKLEQFILNGGTLITFLGNQTRSNSYNVLLGGILPGDLATTIDRPSGLLSNENYSKELEDKLQSVQVQKMFELIPSQNTQVLITATDKKPFLAKKTIGMGTSVLFTSSASTKWNNFAITPVFLPVLANILNPKNSVADSTDNYLVGGKIKIMLSPESKRTVVIDPNGREHEISRENNYFSNTSQPGLYSVVEDDELSYEFPINVDTRESNLAKLEIIPQPPRIEQRGKRVKVYKEIWSYFLWIALVLFATESVCRAVVK